MEICKKESLIKNKLTSIIENFENLNYKNLLSDNLVIDNLTQDIPEIDSNVFFIWIGALKIDKINYLKIWKSSLKKKPTIWIDSNTIILSLYKEVVENFKNKNNLTYLEAQNKLFFYMKKNIKDYNFDQAFIKFIREQSPEIENIIFSTISNHLYSLENLKNQGFIIRDMSRNYKLFFDRTIEFYEYELFLRGNLAAASDIMRYVILYSLGGIYIDVDTLPDFRPIFQKTYIYAKKIKVNLNLVDAYISLLVYNVLYPNEKTKDKDIALDEIKSLLSFPGEKIHKIANHEISLWDKKVPFFEPIFCLSNSIKMAVNLNNNIEYSSNVLACHKKSKIMKILIRELSRRYYYIEEMGFLGFNNKNKNKNKMEYYERLKDYRKDIVNNPNYTTLFLSGPSLILEVILGCTESILKTGCSAEAISLGIRSGNNLSIGISKQITYTVEQFDSSWM